MADYHPNLQRLSKKYPAFFCNNTNVERLEQLLQNNAMRQDVDTRQPVIKKSFTEQVSERIVELLAEAAPGAETVAASFNMSVRTLHRRLGKEDIGYRALLCRLRMDMAADLLCDGHMPLKQISIKLGFSETCNFSRAFKQWYRMSPMAYRNIQL